MVSGIQGTTFFAVEKITILQYQLFFKKKGRG